MKLSFWKSKSQILKFHMIQFQICQCINLVAFSCFPNSVSPVVTPICSTLDVINRCHKSSESMDWLKEVILEIKCQTSVCKLSIAEAEWSYLFSLQNDKNTLVIFPEICTLFEQSCIGKIIISINTLGEDSYILSLREKKKPTLPTNLWDLAK